MLAVLRVIVAIVASTGNKKRTWQQSLMRVQRKSKQRKGGKERAPQGYFNSQDNLLFVILVSDIRMGSSRTGMRFVSFFWRRSAV